MTTIYAIRQISKNKYYIGSTNRYKSRRQQHLYALRHNRHHSPRLQNAWNKYKENDFEFIILFEKEVNEEERLKIEQDFINKYDSYNRGFNSRATTVKLPKIILGENCYNSRKIISYNIETGEIQKYNSISSVDNLSQQNISGCCRNKSLRVKQFFFFYEEDFNLTNLKHRFEIYNKGRGFKLKGRPKSNLHKKKLSKFFSGRKLSKQHIENITKNTPRGITHPSARKIIRSDGKIYNMIHDAAKDNNVCRTAISQNLAGRSKSCAGFTFKYL